jgi:non-ribosomal peptide synthetase component E (peptide arylation enzyme)
MNRPAGTSRLGQLDGVSLRALIDQRAAETPDAVWLIDPESDQKITYADLHQRANAVAATIGAHGIAPGSKVAYAMSNGPDFSLRYPRHHLWRLCRHRNQPCGWQ